MNYKMEKTTSEVYTIRFDQRDWWLQATIIENRGYLALHTSHGDWQYRWSSPGMSFKQFLTTLNNDYLMGKLGQRSYFNGDETKTQIKRDILNKRKEGDYSLKAFDAREFYNFLTKGCRQLDTSNKKIYYRNFDEGLGRNILEKIYEDDFTSIPCFMEYDPALHQFVENLWPAFVEELRKESSNG
jgi:hypothetical protein